MDGARRGSARGWTRPRSSEWPPAAVPCMSTRGQAACRCRRQHPAGRARAGRGPWGSLKKAARCGESRGPDSAFSNTFRRIVEVRGACHDRLARTPLQRRRPTTRCGPGPGRGRRGRNRRRSAAVADRAGGRDGPSALRPPASVLGRLRQTGGRVTTPPPGQIAHHTRWGAAGRAPAGASTPWPARARNCIGAACWPRTTGLPPPAEEGMPSTRFPIWLHE